MTIAIHTDGHNTQEEAELEQQEAVELVSLMALNATDLVEMIDINVLKDLYKEIHLGCEEVRTETRFSARRHKAFNEQVQEHEQEIVRVKRSGIAFREN